MHFIVYYLAGKLFALIVGLIYYKYLPRTYKLVLCLIAIASFCESYGYYIGHHLKEHNAWIFNFYMLIELWIMGLAAYFIVKNNRIKIFFVSLLVTNTVIWVICITRSSIFSYANIAMVFNLVSLSIIFGIVLLTNSLFNKEDMIKQPIFWLSVSTIIYCACNIPYMGMYSYLLAHTPVLAKQLFKINGILDIIRYPLVAISFILLGRQKQVVLKAV